MKNVPLAVQIWLVLAGITLAVTVLMAVFFPWTLRAFFTREIYRTIEEAQQFVVGRLARAEESLDERDPGQHLNVRTVNHVLLRPNGRPLVPRRIPPAFLAAVGSDVRTQNQPVRRYSREVDGELLFYVIRRGELEGRPVYLVSYMWDAYRQDLVRTLFRRLVLVMAAVLVGAWVPAVWLARYLSRPLVQMERHIKRIAEQDWHEPFLLDRRDEIGRLGQTFERMRRQLVHQDEARQLLLQHLSHELKTPVMVIRSYAQSIADGIFPQGDLPRTVQVIDQEAERLEKRVRGLLYLTRLDYMATRPPVREPFRLDALVQEVVERLRWQRPELTWQLELAAVEIAGDREQWRVAVENLVDNQLRYAAQQVVITLFREGWERMGGCSGAGARLSIGNDGPPIPEKMLGELFQAYRKGERGQFGLGLAIVHRIAALHRAQVWAENTADGVCFSIRIPPPDISAGIPPLSAT